MFRSLTFVALAGLASAQISSLPSSCTNALMSIVGNSDASACLNPGALIPLLANNNTDITGPITNWVNGVCSEAPCSNQTLSEIVNILVNGCQSVIAGAENANVDPTTLASSITPLVQEFYPAVRQLVCLRDGNTSCVAETLGNVESVTGPLTIQNIMNVIMLGNVQSLPSNITCTNCIKAAYNIINAADSSIISDAAPALQSQCGTQFTDGSNPSSISSITSNSSSNANTGPSGQSGGALTLVASGLTVTLTIVSAVVVLL